MCFAAWRRDASVPERLASECYLRSLLFAVSSVFMLSRALLSEHGSVFPSVFLLSRELLLAKIGVFFFSLNFFIGKDRRQYS